jgi:hypothetical protein
MLTALCIAAAGSGLCLLLVALTFRSPTPPDV